ncbi:COG1361 S-layer family protein [Methanocaldococcus fervens]|uniref:S-layer domain protein-like protein n=1 Tax=Methanocaldococcus fervens (strain DSM 4213 / JCM 15782 / AG86) TaxID=573064 RepID=C7P741_METFA|nr:COG1361 S-layer family protein [Methanocaldococcus fervens]ACV24373.1 S-layer domain protein-like protein [Methanocaldococcus fervens AG86]
MNVGRYKLGLKEVFKKIALSMILLVAISSVSALQVDELQYQPNVIHPGDDVDVWIKVTNDNYDDEVKDIVVEISPHYPFELRQVNPIKGKATISHLNPGEADTVHFKLHVDENAPSRDYRIDVKVSYDEVDDEDTHHYEFTKIYYIHVYGIASFEIGGNFSLIPSKTQTVPIKIVNKGTGTAKEVNLYVGYSLSSVNAGSESITISAYGTTKNQQKALYYPIAVPLSNLPISPVGETKFYIGALEPGDGKVINLNLHTASNLVEGSYQIPAVITWIDEDGTKRAEQITIGAYVKGDITLDVSNVVTDPVEIKPGITYARIDVTVTNNGHAEAKDVELRLVTDEPFEDSWSNCNIKNIGNLLPGVSKTVSFYVDIDKYAPAKHYKLPIEITYLDAANNEYKAEKYIDIYVKPKPLFEIVTKEVNVIAGRDNQVQIMIKNIGNEKAERVKISVIKISGQPFDYPVKSDTIGTLYPNQTGVGSITITPDRSAESKPYYITLEIRCAGDSEEGDDNVYVYQEPLKVVVKNSASKAWSLLGVLAVVVAIALVVWYVFKRKNKE